MYGGTERVVSYLTEELVRQGHEVTLFASGDSVTSARLVAGCPRALWREASCRDPVPHHLRLVELVSREADRFDVIHFHLDHVHFPVLDRLPCPTVTTLHGCFYPPDEAAFFTAFPQAPLVSISDAQRRPVPGANWQATVYHGLPLGEHPCHVKPGSYLAFLGRISPEKGLENAIEIARRVGRPLRIAARIYSGERPYYEQTIEPLLRASPHVEYVGELGGAAKDEFLGNASALLFPIQWEEPFGLVMIEAMACGTPVVAFRRGSVPEVMTDGVTGFVVDDVADAVQAVRTTEFLDRRACRAAFEARFSVGRMASDYLAVYRRLLVGEACPPCGGWESGVAQAPASPVQRKSRLLGPVPSEPASARA
jgi:glycosyltransferase involved in cell wall biosynthesis